MKKTELYQVIYRDEFTGEQYWSSPLFRTKEDLVRWMKENRSSDIEYEIETKFLFEY